MTRTVTLLTFVCAAICAQAQISSGPFLLRTPTVSRTKIAFVYANDIWVVDRNGGEARRLTDGDTTYQSPHFSPDGKWIAFSARINSNTDVYIMPAEGGPSRRLTYHPLPDVVLGWSGDGSKVLFQSIRSSFAAFERLFTTDLETKGLPTELPLPVATEGALSPDGTRIAYVPLSPWQPDWKRYRGGQTRHIWLADLKTLDIEPIPQLKNSNDYNPVWVGNTVYFLSDRNGPVTLFAYDTQSKRVRQLVENHGYDLKAISASNDAVVYEQLGEIHLLDTATGREGKVNIQVHGDLPSLRPHFQKVEARSLHNFTLSPNGMRAAFEAHGDILTVPADRGDIRNVTNTPGVAERDPAWSPDGKSIAYLSDASGDYALEIRDQSGLAEPRRITLPSSFYYSPRWSPDSKKIVFTDKKSIVWYADVEKGTVHKVDTNPFEDRGMEPAWAPDSKWIAYTKHLRNHLHAICVYSLDQDKQFQITDGMSDARFPQFDANGKYLYFTASTDTGLAVGMGDMTGLDRPNTRSVYVAVLDKSLPSPLPFESDEEKADDKASGPEAKDTNIDAKTAAAPDLPPATPPAAALLAKAKKPVIVRIDIDNFSQRILSLPIPAHNYVNLWAGKEGILFVAEAPVLQSRALIGFSGPTGPLTIHRFDLSKRKTDKLLENVGNFTVSANGDKMLYSIGGNWTIASTTPPLRPGEGTLKLSDLHVWVDPRAEWAQIYHETWRIERDFFYAPNLHGLDIVAAEKRYAAFLPNLSSRDDLLYLSREMLNEMSVGHMFVTEPHDFVEAPHGGLLGADYKIENGRYRFARVYNGENWNPNMRAPLTQPGINVVAGEYLLAINGRELHDSDNIYARLDGTAGHAVQLKVGSDPDGKNARIVTVVPSSEEINLRNLAWMEDNRRKVDELSHGRLAYVWLPNTGEPGYSSFNRYYFAQSDKEGAVIDERHNRGGLLSDYIVEYMRRTKTDCMATREGEDVCHPAAGIFGPKVMITNEMAGSGGDALPWYFKELKIGPLIGKRTWGGLVGVGESPDLMDGGTVTAPRNALYGLNGEWEVEGHGVAPDIEVELDPKAYRDGHDLQLERAVKVALDELEKHPLPKYKRPPYPDYHQQATKLAAGK
jgi:tricorn protease